MALVKIKQIIGTSPKSFEDALKQAVAYAASEKKNVTGAKILDQTVEVKEGKISEYKVNVNIAYRWEKELHNK